MNRHLHAVTHTTAPLPDAELRSVPYRWIRIVLQDQRRRTDRCVGFRAQAPVV